MLLNKICLLPSACAICWLDSDLNFVAESITLTKSFNSQFETLENLWNLIKQLKMSNIRAAKQLVNLMRPHRLKRWGHAKIFVKQNVSISCQRKKFKMFFIAELGQKLKKNLKKKFWKKNFEKNIIIASFLGQKHLFLAFFEISRVFLKVSYE